MSKEVGEAKLDLGGVCEERPEGLGYQQRSSFGQGCVEVSYPRARTVIWLRYFLGFSSSLPQLVWDRQALLLLLLLLLGFPRPLGTGNGRGGGGGIWLGRHG